MNLNYAMLCVDCEEIFSSTYFKACPVCTSESVLHLKGMQNTLSELLKPKDAPVEGKNANS